MALKHIRLELARNPDFPEGHHDCGYEFVAPLDGEGRLNAAEWESAKRACKVRRFWRGEGEEEGRLVHKRTTWAFHYDGTEPEDDEPIYHFDDHRLVEGEYLSITEQDGVMRTFKVVRVH